jgi:hypothetical protein
MLLEYGNFHLVYNLQDDNHYAEYTIHFLHFILRSVSPQSMIKVIPKLASLETCICHPSERKLLGVRVVKVLASSSVGIRHVSTGYSCTQGSCAEL